MKHTIVLDAQEIRAAVDEYLRRKLPDLCKGNGLGIDFSIEKSTVPLTATISLAPLAIGHGAKD